MHKPPPLKCRIRNYSLPLTLLTRLLRGWVVIIRNDLRTPLAYKRSLLPVSRKLQRSINRSLHYLWTSWINNKLLEAKSGERLCILADDLINLATVAENISYPQNSHVDFHPNEKLYFLEQNCNNRNVGECHGARSRGWQAGYEGFQSRYGGESESPI
jgi:hypothetical protein